MGQGYSLTTLSAGSAGIDVPELADLTYERSLGNARFMKTIRARHKDGLVTAKVVMKAYQSMKLDRYVKILLHERKVLADVPNALGYHRILETSTNGYLVRQYIHSSLYDRMSTRPFLEDIEKKWIAFQLLCAVRDCHGRNIYHGDIKTENILVTSWNWVYLSDFSSSFKPTYLPEDNPADFSFYFDTSGRRTCYLAPERFLSAGSQPDETGKINWAMDIFSIGCVIAELFLETPIFSLSQIFKYREGEYDPQQTHLNSIVDKDIREMVLHMIQVEPEARYAADEYLNFWRKKAFPDYFYNFLHQYMYTITDPTSGRKPVTSANENLGESDDRIEKILNDFDKISYFLGNDNGPEQTKVTKAVPRTTGSLFPLHINIPNYKHQVKSAGGQIADDGTLIFLTLIVVSLRSTARAAARIQACELLLAFGERTTDEAKLDRIVPYIMSLLTDQSDMVKVAALRTLTQLLSTVTVVSPINASIFPEYILPRLLHFVPGHKSKPSALVRMTYATCLAPLATTAYRFLDMMQALRADGSLPANDPEAETDSVTDSQYQNLFDVAREDLINQFAVQTTALFADSDTTVRRAFLGSVSTLCVFFGSSKASDVILSHLNTYLNDKDWTLKCAFFETIVGVAIYVGGAALEEFILPLMLQALTDPEDFVVEKVLRSLSSMANLGLFQRSRTWELVNITSPFTMHPNPWIREAAAQFVSASTTYLSVADTHCIIVPLIRPYLKVLPSDLSELRLLDSLKKPLPRIVLEMASNWAMSADKGEFWIAASQQKGFAFGVDGAIPTTSTRDFGHKVLSQLRKNEEDEQWLSRLRNGGMAGEDEVKLLALREYIWRVSHRKAKLEFEPQASLYNKVVSLIEDLKINPQTIFFEDIKEAFQQAIDQDEADGIDRGPRTITDALLDASTTVDDTISRRTSSHNNSRAERLSRGAGEDSPARLSSPLPAAIATPTETSALPMRKSRSQLSPSELSPVGSVGASRTMRHRGSAINLLHRGDLGGKANAETSTTSTNAFGKVEGGSSRDASTRRRAASPPLAIAQERNRIHPHSIRFQSAHSYTGHDPSILKLLDTLFLENYPVDYAEFGPNVVPLGGRQPIRRDTGQVSNASWRPEGVLVAMLGEHTAAVTRVAVSPDHHFFVTGSDDGSVKIWDTERLERNLTHRSRLTYKLSEGAKVTSLTFIENTHCIAITGSDGSVHVIKVPLSRVKDSNRFGKILVLREYQLLPGEHATWCEHYKNENQSILLLATSQSRVLALELRTMSEIFELKNPLHHGTLTSFCLDKKRHWLLLGTSHGVLDLWDLRFKLRLKAWGLRGSSPIHRVMLLPVRRASRKIYVAGGTGPGEVTVWDLDKKQCLQVYRTSQAKGEFKGFEMIDIDEERPGGMLGRFATSVEPGSSSSADRGIRSITMGAHVLSDGGEPKQFFLLSAGPDWKVRYWDISRFDASNASMVVSGLEFEETMPAYEIRRADGAPETVVINERFPPPQNTQQSAASPSSRAPSNSSKRNTGKTRPSVISVQQQHLLKSHLDNIMDVALLEHPYGMVVSVDRSGLTYVFQ